MGRAVDALKEVTPARPKDDGQELPDGNQQARSDSQARTDRPGRDEEDPDPEPATAPEPEPFIDDDDVEAPESFPVKDLGRIVGGAMLALHRDIKSPVAMCVSSVLYGAALAAQPHLDVVDVFHRGHREPLSLLFMTVGESGERKTATDDAALAEHTLVEQERIATTRALFEVYQAELAAHETAVAAVKKAHGKNVDKKIVTAALQEFGRRPRPPRSGVFMLSRPSMQGLAKLFVEDRALSAGLNTSEGGVFLGGYAMNEDNITATLGALADLRDSGTTERSVGGEARVKAYDRRFSMHIMLQPHLLERVLNNTEIMVQGTFARMLITYPPSTMGTRLLLEPNQEREAFIRSGLQELGLTEATTDNFAVVMRTLLTRPMPVKKDKDGNETDQLEPPGVHLAPEAMAAWKRFHDQLEKALTEGGSIGRSGPGRPRVRKPRCALPGCCSWSRTRRRWSSSSLGR